MTHWIDELQAALADEYGSKPRVATLATVDADNRPRARSVVCRKLHDDGSLWITSDSRSDKNLQLADRPFAEVVFWLRNRFEQYRVAGGVQLIDHEDARRAESWRALSDASRAMFFWPVPGTSFVASEELRQVPPATAPIPSAFSLLILRPDQVEHLDLKPQPHVRRRWERATNWAPQRLHA